jgi:acetyltransferase-like isoleucine patch superfamily enzyme
MVSTDSEQKTQFTASPGLRARIGRAWARDSGLSLARRLQKGIQLACQLVRARSALKACNRVGASARVAGRLRVENHGSIVIGDHININSSWVPTELLTGNEGHIEIGDDVLINFGTVIAAGKGVTIGSGSMIGPHCIISDMDIPEAVAEPGSAAAKPIVIGRDVWIAGRVTVRAGVTIGDGAVVVAGSIVESDVPPQVMASGIPARLLPKLGVVPQAPNAGSSAPAPTSQAAESAGLVLGRAMDEIQPELCGSLISDFSLDELAHELLVADMSPPVDSVVVPWGQFPQSLSAAPLSTARDFAVIWTSPDMAVAAFSRLLMGQSIDERTLLAEVDAFCGVIDQTAANYRYVLVPTWTQPVYLRGQGLFDGRPGGVLLALTSMNLRLMSILGRRPNVFVLDAARWQAAVGPLASNPRAWYLGHMAAARPFVVEAARDIRAALGTLYGRQRSLLVLDGEDALWDEGLAGSMASPASPEPIGAAFDDFQRVLRALKNRGVLLALLRKNQKSAPVQPIRGHSSLTLREEDFTICNSAEGEEAASLNALATRLGVGLGAMVYVTARDDARLRVRGALPAVYTPDWPIDKLLFPSALQRLRCFDVARGVGDRAATA